ncbi:unnamed protein product [Rhizoctonia solani]|uniref:BTB domain-containing protein n=1 Tax=Rhizoctonia solani TaxID=456999 RepID=A0A8H3A692_9AGAM|nr:unnamed protein product [Rhizoctonia solani]
MATDSFNNLESPELVLSKDETKTVTTSQDSDYYFEDGSVTFRVEETLFKVHASLLKLRPSDFEGRFDVSTECVGSTRGTCDDTPLVIPDIKSSQFRNLMKVIYCPPSNKFFLSLPAIASADIEERDAWRQFVFYLDVAALAHRFSMRDIEKWAKPRLRSLVRTAALKISDGLDSTSNDDVLEFGLNPEGDSDSEGDQRDDSEIEEYVENSEDQDESGEEDNGDSGGREESNKSNTDSESDSDKDEDYESDEDSSSDDKLDSDSDSSKGQRDNELFTKAEESPIFRFMDGIWYAKDISDTALLHDIRNILQHHFTKVHYLPVDMLLSFFRVSNLRQRDTPMFGFLFLLLLGHGHKAWDENIFTQVDRMALFSAQCYLTPLPDSLKVPSAAPLFKKIDCAKRFAKRFTSSQVKPSCVKECYREMFPFWADEFGDAYYKHMTSNEPLVAIKSLASIPHRRLNFSEKIRAKECGHQCYLKMLGQVDRDIQGLYARLAEYYKPIA